MAEAAVEYVSGCPKCTSSPKYVIQRHRFLQPDQLLSLFNFVAGSLRSQINELNDQQTYKSETVKYNYTRFTLYT